jgi:hypothetical protein
VGPVAQRLEQRTHNPLVLGSNPSGPTNYFLYSPERFFAYYSQSTRWQTNKKASAAKSS